MSLLDPSISLLLWDLEHVPDLFFSLLCLRFSLCHSAGSFSAASNKLKSFESYKTLLNPVTHFRYPLIPLLPLLGILFRRLICNFCLYLLPQLLSSLQNPQIMLLLLITRSISLGLTCLWNLHCGHSLLLETPYSLGFWDMLLSWYSSYFLIIPCQPLCPYQSHGKPQGFGLIQLNLQPDITPELLSMYYPTTY